MADMYRFGRVQEMVDRGDFGTRSVVPRATKFPLLEVEGMYNPNIEDNPTLGCLPLSW